MSETPIEPDAGSDDLEPGSSKGQGAELGLDGEPSSFEPEEDPDAVERPE